MATNSFLAAWADCGLADVIAFDPSGKVTSAACSLLLGISIGDNVFERLPILHGCEDIFDSASHADYPISFPGVCMVDRAYSSAFDFRIGHDRVNRQAYVLVTPAAGRDNTAEMLIQERRRARHLQQQIDYERAQFKRIYRQSPIAAFAVDEHDKLIAVTEKLEEWIGPETDIELWVTSLLETVDNGPGHANETGTDPSLVYPISVGGTAIVLVRLHLDIVVTKEGMNHRYYVLEDITDLYAAYQTAEQSRKALEIRTREVLVSNNRLHHFAQVAAHDLLGPIGRVASFAELIEKKVQHLTDTIVPASLNAIRVSALESVSVIRELLALAQLNNSKPAIGLVDLVDISEQIKRHHGFNEDVVIKVEAECAILGDTRLISLILRNLFSNSYKYRAKDRQLEIVIRSQAKDDESATLLVRDNGNGFSLNSEKVFGAFVRSDEHAEIEGTGLGLSMVKDAASAMGWQTTIKSITSEGTDVVFTGVRQFCA